MWYLKLKKLDIKDIAAFILFLSIVLITKSYTLTLPYFWDEIVAYAEPIYDLYHTGPSYFLLEGANFDHPYGLTLILTALFYIFGPSILLVRIFCTLITVLTMFVIYKFVPKEKSLWLGIPAAILFFSLPSVFVQSTMLVSDNILAGYGILFLYLIYKEKYVPAIFLGFLMGFTRETALAFMPPSLIYIFFKRDFSKNSILSSLSPFLGLVSFFLMQKILYGSFFTHRALVEKHVDFSRDWGEIFYLFSNHFSRVFLDRGKTYLLHIGFLSSLILVTVFFYKSVRKKSAHFPVPLAMVLSILSLYLCFLGFFSFHAITLERYFYPLLPITVLVSLTLLSKISKYLPLLSLAIIPLEFYPRYGIDSCTTTWGTGNEYDMEYISVLETHKMGSEYVYAQYNRKGLIVCTGWPMAAELTVPSSGYFNEKTRMEVRDHFTEDCDVFLWSNNMDQEILDLKEPLLKEGKIHLKKRFEHKCKLYEVYETNAFSQREKAQKQ